MVLLSAHLLHFAAAAPRKISGKQQLPRTAFPKAPAEPGSSAAAATWPGAYTGGPEPTIWRRPVILLLGDSITQMGSNLYDGYPGWVANMQAHYNRKADIVNRGFGGFNTKTALLALPEVMDMLSKQQVALAIVWLGANDAAVPEGSDGRAHVPVDAYQANLQAIVTKLLADGVERVLLVTPSPVYDGAAGAIPHGETVPPRQFKSVEKYAEAARKAAAAFPSKVYLADAFQQFVSVGDWGNRLMAQDGLHLSRAGNDHVWNIMYNAINDKMQLTSNNLPMHHADWWFIDFAGADQQFAAEQAAYRAVFRTK